MARPTIRTERTRRIIIEQFAHGATVRAALQVAGIARSAYYEWIESDPQFATQVAAAKEAHGQYRENVAIHLLEESESLPILLLNAQTAERTITATLFDPIDTKGGGRIPPAERTRRAIVEALDANLTVCEADDPDLIRTEALELFAKHLDGKIKNLQDGEKLQITFSVDIVQANGKVRGGSGSERNMPDYIAWRKAVYARDNYSCQQCGAQGEKLEAHHIRPWSSYPEGRFDIKNGMTLCADCHAQQHPHLRMVRHG